jgi:hypothetical protein
VNPDVVIAKAHELKEAREHVQELEAELRMLVTGEEGYGNYTAIGQLEALRNAASMVDKIVSLLEHSPIRIFHFKEIYKTVGGNEASVRSTIAKLINDKKIQRVTWGAYQALQKEERPKASAVGLPPPPKISDR